MDNLVFLNCSGGKDSVASLIVAKEHNVHIDCVVFSEFMFSNFENIPSEYPEHFTWKHNVLIPFIKSLGYNVKVIRPDLDYLSLFYRKYKFSSVSSRNGKFWGFPLGSGCYCKNYLKIRPLSKFYSSFPNHKSIIGYACDESKRLKSLSSNQFSVLYNYNITESRAFDICSSYNLLSPSYSLDFRDGCWFCPNSPIKRFLFYKSNYPLLWDRLRLLSLESNLVSNNFSYGRSFSQIDNLLDILINQVSFFDLYSDDILFSM